MNYATLGGSFDVLLPLGFQLFLFRQFLRIALQKVLVSIIFFIKEKFLEYVAYFSGMED